MQAPTSNYGCGADDCIACYGDEEWRASQQGWTHDPTRDGAGCSWCGAYAQVDADNLCRECWEVDEQETA